MKQVLLFAGTSEGRRLAEHFQGRPLAFTVCVATEYGKELLPQGGQYTILAQRLDAAAMIALLQSQTFDCVIDATHPYAVEASQNIRQACTVAETRYFRLERAAAGACQPAAGCVWLPDTAAAVAYLNRQEGKALLTTGSKELAAFTEVQNYQQRLYARILPLPQGLAEALGLGYPAAHLLAMQGPFSAQLNAAMLRETGAQYLVTKESGKAGGFREKLEGAKTAGATALIIQRPQIQQGRTEQQMIQWLEEHYL